LGILALLFCRNVQILFFDAKIKWRHVWVGVTALAERLSKFGLEAYFGQSQSRSSGYGAAGSIILILLLGFLLFNVFFGAEFTHLHEKTDGRQRQMSMQLKCGSDVEVTDGSWSALNL
jgi:uncharacterized BrkB/YihY/UPF0761 family membrane protein